MSFKFTRSLPDTYYKAVVLCNSNNTSDISRWGYGATALGSPTFNDSIVKFGNNSVGLNITSDSCIDIGYNSYFNPLRYGDDYTIEIWVYPTSYATIGNGYTKYVVSTGYSTSPYAAIFIALNCNGTIDGDFRNAWFVNGNASGSGNDGIYTSANNTVPLGTWTHLCETREGNTVYYFINGNLLNTRVTTTNFGNMSSNSQWNMRIGHLQRSKGLIQNNDTNSFIGYVQNIKFSTICRYTSNFTPSKPW